MAEDQSRLLFADDSLEAKLLEAELAKSDTKAQKVAVQDRLKLSDNIKNNVKTDNRPVIVYLANPSTDYNNEQFTNEILQVLSQYSPRLALVKAYEFVSDQDIPRRALIAKIISAVESRKLTKERFAKTKEALAAAKAKYTEERLAGESEIELEINVNQEPSSDSATTKKAEPAAATTKK